MRRERASASLENHEIKSIRVTVRRSFNENSVSFSVFSRIFLVSRVNTCNTLKKHWNHQWTYWISSYANHSSKVASLQLNYVIEYHIKLFLNEVIRRLQKLASFSKNKLSFLVFFVELKETSSAMNVAKLQNLHNEASAIYNILRLHQTIDEKNDFYDRVWVLSLNINDEMWRLRCHWVSKNDYEYDIYYSKILRCWTIEDSRVTTVSKTRASMRNIVNRMRDVLFKDLYTAMNIYEKTFNSQLLNFKFYQISYNVRSESENDSVLLTSDHFSIDETQSVEFDAQLNTALKSQEILEIDSESVHEFIESAWVDISISTQQSSLFNIKNDKKELRKKEWELENLTRS